jgi:DNA-binding transcriptional regulator LsrR (DeoR family)
MSAERVAMRQAREFTRLKFSAAVTTRQIARRLRVAPSTVRETLNGVESAGLAWPLPQGLSDGDLEAALYARHTTVPEHVPSAHPIRELDDRAQPG